MPEITTYDNLALCSVETITFVESNGNFGALIDEISSVSMQNDQTEVDITGKNGRKIGTLKRDKSTTFSGVSALLSGDLLSAQTGGAYAAKPLQTVDFREEITLTDPTTATLKYEANSGIEGKEVDFVIKVVGAGIDKSTALKQGVAVSDKTFTYDPETRTLTFAEGCFNENDLVCVFYKRLVPATVLTNSAETFSKVGTASIDLLAQDLCDNMYRVQFQIPRAQFSGTFTIDVGDQQTVHNFEIKALAAKKGCGTEESLENGMLWNYIVWDKGLGELEDATVTITPVEPDEPTTPDEPATGGDDENGGDNGDNNNPGSEVELPDTTVTKAMIATLTNEVQAALNDVTVSADGTDVPATDKWITQEQSDTVEAAIAEGKRIGTTTGVSQDEKDAAYLALEAAKNVIAAAQEGTAA